MSNWVQVRVTTSSMYLVEVKGNECAIDVAYNEIDEDQYGYVEANEIGIPKDLEQAKRFADKIINI